MSDVSLPGLESSELDELALPLDVVIQEETRTGLKEKLLTEMVRREIAWKIGIQARLFEQKWTLLHTTQLDGFSLRTIYAEMEKAKKGKFLTVIKDTEGGCFGVFSPVPWKQSPHAYGSPECFLWKETNATVLFFPASLNSPYYLISDQSFLAAGCCDGLYGLLIDCSRRAGTSNPVDTYNNPVLSATPRFSCVALEIWNITSAK